MRQSSSRRIATLAAEVLPVCAMLPAQRAGIHPELFHRQVDDALVCLMEHKAIDLRGFDTRTLEHPFCTCRQNLSRKAKHRAPVHSAARGITAVPSTSFGAQSDMSSPRDPHAAYSGEASACALRTAAPAPSPNNTHVERSVKSSTRLTASTPTTNRIGPRAVEQKLFGNICRA